jgi:hypothetical protein
VRKSNLIDAKKIKPKPAAKQRQRRGKDAAREETLAEEANRQILGVMPKKQKWEGDFGETPELSE